MKTMTRHEEGYFKAQQGDKLYYHSYTPKKTQAHLVIVHGMAEHSHRYLHVVDFFNQAGFAVHLYDLRGHGKSPGIRAFAESFNQLVEDLKEFIDRVRKQADAQPIFLIAHSFGGQIAANFLAKYPGRVAGAVLSSPNLKLKMEVPLLKRVAARTLSRLFPKVSLGNEINPEFVSHDPKIVFQYKSDPQIQKRLTLRLGAETLQNLDEVMAMAKKIKDPILVLHGEEDPITSPEGSREFFSKLTVKDRKLKTYPGFLHEIFNELGKEKVFTDINQWLAKRLS